ncbi:hypothetical protein N9J19_00650 [bacterium]|nr:hypothetical protein [bacterium]
MPDFAQFDDVQDHKAAERFAQANTGGVSTLTHSTAFVAKHFLEWRARQKPRVEINHDMMAHLANSSKGTTKKNNGGLRGAAFNMFTAGSSVKQVSTELNITYANAHYYSRAFKKSC